MTLVLIADDDTAVRGLLRAAVEAAGYEVVEAADGEAAWTGVRARRPDVLLLDVHMPGRDGLTVLQAVKRDPALAGTRVIINSGSTEEAEAALEAGADAYLVKPCKLAALHAALAG
jgi:CheY-like chemotaxis protein